MKKDLSLQRLQRAQNQMKDEMLMWTHLTCASRSNFQALRLCICGSTTPKWEPPFDAWFRSVYDVHWQIKAIVDEEMWKRAETLSAEELLFGLCRLKGFDSALRATLQSHRLMDETDSESSGEMSCDDEDESMSQESR